VDVVADGLHGISSPDDPDIGLPRQAFKLRKGRSANLPHAVAA
jgi:hypothetical protein